MKVLGINRSARKDGNTAILMNKVFAALKMKQGLKLSRCSLPDK